jgi:hypothetical protein
MRRRVRIRGCRERGDDVSTHADEQAEKSQSGSEFAIQADTDRDATDGQEDPQQEFVGRRPGTGASGHKWMHGREADKNGTDSNAGFGYASETIRMTTRQPTTVAAYHHGGAATAKPSMFHGPGADR